MMAGTLLAAIPCVAHSAVLYLGLASGRTYAYTRADGGGWTRSTSADLPDVGYDAVPAFADLDGDGDRDVLIGERGGRLLGYENTGSNGTPRWARQAAWDMPVDVGSDAAPALADLDGDGDADLLVGSTSGDVRGFESMAGNWAERPSWGLGKVGANAHPALGDINGDGKIDVLVGTGSGAVMAFAGTGNTAGLFVRRVEWDGPQVGQRVAPTLGDLDGDNRPDLILADVNAVMTAFKNAGGGVWTISPWAPRDPGSGPAAPVLVAGGLGGAGAPPSASELTAELVASTLSGPPPLDVHFDATGSSDPDGKQLTFSFNFGDTPGGSDDGGNDDGSDDGGDDGGTPPPSGDAAAVLRAAIADYTHAHDVHYAKHFEQSVPLYLAAVAEFLKLTSVTAPGPVSIKGTNRIDRVSRWYLQAIGHHLGGMYLWHSLALSICDRYEMSLQYSWESAAQAVAGGFPGLPPINGTNGNIEKVKAKMHQNGCAIPAPKPMFALTAALPTEGTADHTYTVPGTYTATMTVRAGGRSAMATVEIVVGSGHNAGSTPPFGGGDGNSDKAEGFGSGTPGGAGGRQIHVSEPTDAAVRAAFKEASGGHAIVIFDTAKPIELSGPLPRLDGPFITIEGNGATLIGTRITRTAASIDVRGHDVIVRNLRLRSGGDNLRATGDGAYNIVFSHISSTGAGDDGISIAYGAHDVTVQYSFLAGNTRSLFLKYGNTTRLSIHHTWVMKQWIRGPLVSTGVMLDLRNVIVEDWAGWGTCYQAESSGNVVNSLYTLSSYARSVGGSPTALNLTTSGRVFTAGNVFRDRAHAAEGRETAPLDAPPVTTHSVAEMTDLVHARAGCLPRDATDQAYIDTKTGWDVSKFSPFRLE
jgi:PKD repeat protein